VPGLSRTPGVLGLLAWFAVGCSFDSSGNSDVNNDAAASTPDASSSAIDASSAPDAPPPVECESAADCQTPPDPCHLPGVCNLTLNKCEFSAVDCTSEDDACNVGVCNIADGSCEKFPSFEGTTCQSPNIGSFTSCSFATPCDLAGTRSRSRTDFTCNTGSCDGTTTIEVDDCFRLGGDVVGDPCGPDTCAACGTCSGFSSTCDETGSCSRSCMRDQCTALGACVTVGYTIAESCTRMTDGDTCPSCGGATCVCDEGSCTEVDPGPGG